VNLVITTIIPQAFITHIWNLFHQYFLRSNYNNSLTFFVLI
jgi:hypothetical protein